MTIQSVYDMDLGIMWLFIPYYDYCVKYSVSTTLIENNPYYDTTFTSLGSQVCPCDQAEYTSFEETNENTNTTYTYYTDKKGIA